MKKIHWFKVSVAFLACILFLTFPSCQKDELDQGSIPDMDNMSPSASSKKDKLTGKVKDVDGNWYKTVKIGDQWWMAENLKTTKLNNRISIPLIENKEEWYSRTKSAYCWYGNEDANKDIYGALYNWYAVNTGKLCPKGWHVSTIIDWLDLLDFLGPTVSGLKIKETGTAHWYYSEYAVATNESGFTALGAGVRWWGDINDFFLLKYRASWWTSTMYDDLNAWFFHLRYDFPDVWGPAAHPYVHGNSVRCVKD